jgi:membrane protein required for colicin V production
MSWVDLAVLGVVALSALLAFLRGLVREVLGIGAWLAAGLGAVWGLPIARPEVHQWFGDPPWVEPATFVVIFLALLLVLMLIARAISGVVRNSPLGGLDRTLGLVFGILRGAALIIIAYIVGGMVVPVDHWPEPVLEARLLAPTFEGARWAVLMVPVEYRPRLYAPPPGREASADALLHVTPQGSALGRVAARPSARD